MILDFYNQIKHKNFISKHVYLFAIKLKKKNSRYLYNYPKIQIFFAYILKYLLFFNRDIGLSYEKFIYDVRNINSLKTSKIKLLNFNKYNFKENLEFYFPKKVGVYALLNNLTFIEEWCKQRSINVVFNDHNWVYGININKVIPIWNFKKAKYNTIDKEISKIIFEEVRNDINLTYKLDLVNHRINKNKILKKNYLNYYNKIKSEKYMNKYLYILDKFRNKNIFNINTGGKGFETVIPSLDGLVKMINNSQDSIDLIICEDSFLLQKVQKATNINTWEFVSNKKTENKVTNKGYNNIIEINLKSLMMANANKIFADPLSNIATGPLLFSKTLKCHDKAFPYSKKIIIP